MILQCVFFQFIFFILFILILFKYGWVFGIANLAAFLLAPICGKFGTKIGVKYLYNIGAFLQSSVGFAFGFLVYAENTAVFLALSYILMYVQIKYVSNANRSSHFVLLLASYKLHDNKLYIGRASSLTVVSFMTHFFRYSKSHVIILDI